MKNKIHSLIVEGIVFCGSGLVLLSYSLSSYAKGFNKSWAQSPYLFPLIVAIAMMIFMGVRKIPVLVFVPIGTTLFLSLAFRTFLHVLLP